MNALKQWGGFVMLLAFMLMVWQAACAQEKLPAESGLKMNISWVRQFPPDEKDKEKKGFTKKVGQLITGKDEGARLIKPVAVVASDPDSFLVLDQGYGALFEITKNKIAIPHALRKKFNDFSSLVGMCKNTEGEILFTDSRQNKVFRVTADKKNIIPVTDSVLKQPTGIAWSSVGREIWVVETAAHRISVLDEKGKLIRTIGKRGTAPGEFNFPTHICIDKEGNACIVDAMNFRVQIFNKRGEFISTFGQAGDVTGYFARPKGIAVDSYGNIYIVDALFHAVQVFSAKGDYLYRFGEQGQQKEEFWMPSGIYIDRNDYIYVADTYNSRVQVFRVRGER